MPQPCYIDLSVAVSFVENSLSIAKTMLSLSPVSLLLWFRCMFVVQSSFAIDLEPIRPPKMRSRLEKRYDESALDLRNVATFLWGANGYHALQFACYSHVLIIMQDHLMWCLPTSPSPCQETQRTSCQWRSSTTCSGLLIAGPRP